MVAVLTAACGRSAGNKGKSGDAQGGVAGTAMSSGGTRAGSAGGRVAGSGGTAAGGGNEDGGSSDGGSEDGGKSDGGRSDGGRSDGGKSDGGAGDSGGTDGGAGGAPNDCGTTLAGPPRCELVASMDQARGEHSATLLPNGKVLVVGGVAGSDRNATDVATAELYDPSTDTWSPAGALGDARHAHGAVLLRDGRVLVVGGVSEGYAIGTAELYDPSTNTWSPTEPAPSSGRAVRLRGGKVLLIGAHVTDNTTGLYDPVTETWSPTALEAHLRSGFEATLLESGRVLISGGFSIEPFTPPVLEAEAYDPARGVWSPAGELSRMRNGHAPVRLASGRVLISGGYPQAPSPTPPASTEIYDPRSNAWSPGEDLSEARWMHTATLLCDGRIFVAGGSMSSGEGSALASAELYDESSGEFSLTAPLNVARWSHTATLLPDGRVLIVGGNDGTNLIGSVEVCTHATP